MDSVEQAKQDWIQSIRNDEPEELQKALSKIYENEFFRKVEKEKEEKSFFKTFSKDVSKLAEESKKKFSEFSEKSGKFIHDSFDRR